MVVRLVLVIGWMLAMVLLTPAAASAACVDVRYGNRSSQVAADGGTCKDKARDGAVAIAAAGVAAAGAAAGGAAVRSPRPRGKRRPRRRKRRVKRRRDAEKRRREQERIKKKRELEEERRREGRLRRWWRRWREWWRRNKARPGDPWRRSGDRAAGSADNGNQWADALERFSDPNGPIPYANSLPGNFGLYAQWAGISVPWLIRVYGPIIREWKWW